MSSTLDRGPTRTGAPRDDVPAPRRTWARPLSPAVLLAGTAVLYLWNLGASGWANSFYAAAVQAGANDWTAFLFGSLDPSNAITVDKPPASLWPMEIAARVFGFSSWSMLVPQALMGVASVWLLYATVRRVSGHGAGLLAGALLALTPVAALMFRFNNPDALLTLLLVAAAYLAVRGVADGRTRWIAGAGLVIGFAFLTKSLQAFLILPGLTLAYLWAAPGRPWRRAWQVLVAGAGVGVGAGWWLLTVALWPADSRPYIGGSGDNTPLGLAFGYNGLGRIFGESGGGMGGGGMPGGGMPDGGQMGGDAAGTAPDSAGATGGMPPGGGTGGGMNTAFGGEPGLLRMFESAFGTQISWLLPAAVLLLVAGIALRGRASRTDPVRASLLLWGGWTLVTALVFSLMSGIVHPYYAVALAPGIAALVAIGGREVLAHRQRWWARAVLGLAVAGTAVWAFELLGRSPDFLPWLRWVVLVLGVLAGAALVLPARRGRWLAVLVGAALLTGLAAPAAYAVQTAATPQSGSIPTAGPEVSGTGAFGGPGNGAPGGPGNGPAGSASAGDAPAGPAGDGSGPAGGAQTGSPRDRDDGAPGGTETSAELAALLRTAGDSRWAAATIGSQGAASMMLTAGGDTAVMAIGGFSGGDEYPTLAQFQSSVERGEIRYFVDGAGPGGGGPGGGRGTAAEITEWVRAHYPATTVGGSTVHDLTTPTT
ncbi:glycosyltransferase family 39 protein [Pseudonocardia nematodicida]|uniref:Glycosyltransferase family 39 protein n=1 Tax=Pseudonocardia nematodicida TaxID=1206997 RepID=A0ABV1KI31_9PSEU